MGDDRAAFRAPLLEGLAGNPRLPRDLAERLVGNPESAEELASAYPAMDIPLAEKITATGRVPLIVWLVRNPSTPNTYIWRLGGHPAPEVRAAVAETLTIPESGPHAGPVRRLLERLAEDADVSVRKAVAGREVPTPLPVLAALALDPDPGVRFSMVWQAPAPLRRVLLTDPDPEVRKRAAGLFREYPPHLEAGLLADPVTRAQAAAKVRLDADLAMELATDPDSNVWYQVADNPGLTPDAFAVLRASGDDGVMATLAVRGDIDEATRAAIAREGRFSDGDTSLAGFFAAESWKETIRPWLWDAPDSVKTAQATAGLWFMRPIVAQLPGLSREAVEALLAYGTVTAALVAESNREQLTVAELLDCIREVGKFPMTDWFRSRILDSPGFPTEVLAPFADERGDEGTDGAWLRMLACRYDGLPADVAARLAADYVDYVRAAAARLPAMPLDALGRLLRDPDPDVRKSAASSPALPADWMRRIVDAAGR